MIQFDDKAFVESFDRAVAEKGRDYVYPTRGGTQPCYYVWEGKPDCLIGCALIGMGYTVEDLQTLQVGNDVCGVDARNGATANIVLGALGASDMTRRAARIAQNRQDGGQTWGVAQDSFHEMLKSGPIF